ncbi:MAG: hypothetical protein HYU33_02845 [Candidatus Omnitrophica bacterium]|nr:hypothetical protein [Candidatus Omnitrophota bacterium]MBI3078251.1 hypothetical protein [Deltaproteobacteria bacterium]
MSFQGSPPLHIAFIWHFHQPYYRLPGHAEALLPWVALHGTKDYYDLGAILEEFPHLHQTFNFVPSLLVQLEAYGAGGSDVFLTAAQTPADALTGEQRRFLLQHFFAGNWEHMVRPFPRYWELLRRRGFRVGDRELEAAARFFTVQECRDLQVLFMLAWMDPLFRQREPFLRELVAKGRDFTEEEKAGLLARQQEILRQIIPKYQELQGRGIVEVATSAFYHPILPLLCDTESAREAMPQATLPRRFAWPADAAAQLHRALACHERLFGSRPVGLWPSEGSVSETILPLLAEAGFTWLASDEEVLEQSLGQRLDRQPGGLPRMPASLYQAYRLEGGDAALAIIFRDHTLSDLLGFTYARWDAREAATDLVGRLLGIRRALGAQNLRGDHLVTTILDGENPWENYPNDGHDFLRCLYEALSREPALRLVTVREHLAEHPPDAPLPRLFAGSWINHSFSTWIGDPIKNAAWERLADAREALAIITAAAHRADTGAPGETSTSGEGGRPGICLGEAWESLYIAEGSDWFWWYGEPHSSPYEREFDELFRAHLKHVYQAIGQDPPPILDLPLVTEARPRRGTAPTGFITPRIDGRVTDYFEWLAAGRYDPAQASGAMHRMEHWILALYYGFDLRHLYLRLDLIDPSELPSDAPLIVELHLVHPTHARVLLPLTHAPLLPQLLVRPDEQAPWTPRSATLRAAFVQILELALPFAALGLTPVQECWFSVHLTYAGQIVDRVPDEGYLIFTVPTEDFEATFWSV